MELPLKKDPRLAVMLPVETLRVYAMLFSGQWFFSWGRGHMQRIDALADNAAQKIYEVATR
ncbi:hypothetical protein ACIBCT_35140 [Streptosporangium sp. NPDC050855]|uniref:hypothetical protein n=1 Tax=Streptosporangium sp. NPDC050855 TaxID=3366194 RepID=UPI003794FF30